MLSVKLSIIIPAFNEAAYIGATLDSLEAAAAHLRTQSGAEVELIVVDNNSTDDTAAVARSKGAAVVAEPVQGIARARNAGARRAKGDVLVFVDADVTAPATFLAAIHAAMADPSCVGRRRRRGVPPAALARQAPSARLAAVGPADGHGPGPHAVLPRVRVRGGRRL